MGSRYYESELKGDEIKPGTISDELKAALNLAENDLPIWIYRMRALGYPPGWLNKAIVDTSDIFDDDDNDNNNQAQDNNEASKKRKNPSDEVQYDHSKLIEYPGFNAPLPPNVTDYHYYYNMPPMLPHQQLEYAKKHMNAFEPAPIPKRIRTSIASNEGQASSSPKKKKKKTKSLDESAQVETGDTSPGECPASPDGGEGASDVSKEGNDNDHEEDDEADESSGEGEEESNDDVDDKANHSKVKSNMSSSLSEEIKLVSKGSPMPEPVRRLPLERFSEGVVGELLYFENTPTSSGKFETIRGLLDTIRRQD